MDELRPPTTADLRGLRVRVWAGLVGVFLAVFACKVGAILSPRLEPFFFWLMLGVCGLAITVFVRGKIRFARTHRADGLIEASGYQLRVERRARLLGICMLWAWLLSIAASTIVPSLRWPCLWAVLVFLVGLLVAFGVDEWRHAKGRSAD